MNEIYSEEVKKKLVFLKQRHYEAGSKAMKLLSYKLRKQQADATINKIRCPQTKKKSNLDQTKLNKLLKIIIRNYILSQIWIMKKR